jgi:hypothetical protein
VAFAKTVTWTIRRKQGRHGETSGARLAGGTGSTTGAATASGGATTATRRPTRTRHVDWTALRAISASRPCNRVKLTLLSVCVMAVPAGGHQVAFVSRSLFAMRPWTSRGRSSA